jgi:TetR/AcrR family transcriptional regulator, repressor for uid operon
VPVSASEQVRTPSAVEGGRRRGRPPASAGDETRVRIIKAARVVFAELGYDAATFQTVADRAEVTRPCINYYFAGKRVLYRAVGMHAVAGVMVSSVDRACRERGVAARLTAFVDCWVRADEESPGCRDFLAMSLLDGQRDDSLRHEFRCGLVELRAFLSRVVTDAECEGELAEGTESAELVEMLLAIVCGVLISPGRGGATASMLGPLLSGALWTFRPGVNTDACQVRRASG